MHDNFREIDLNPPAAAGGPINNPLDPRAMFYFGFLATDQEISFGFPMPAGQPRVLISFHYANQPTAVPPALQPPIDAVLDFGAGMPMVQRLNHERSHVIVWLDPAALPPPGTPCIVRISARATK